MSEEFIDIVTKDGKATGKTALKSEIHTKGYYHNTTHIWFFTETGYILLAQRAATKNIYPLLWDVSVAGHVEAGETIKQAAIREIQEEIGLTVTEADLHKIGVFPCFQVYENRMIDNEFHHTYISKLTVPIKNLNLQHEEVESIKLVSIKKFKKLLEESKTNNHFVAANKTYYLKVINDILQHL